MAFMAFPGPPRFGPGSQSPTTDADWRNLYLWFVNVANRLRSITSGMTTRKALTVTTSPFVLQNTTLVQMLLFISGTLTTLAVSADGLTYDSWPTPPAQTFITLPPGAFLKLTYAGAAPIVAQYSS